MRWRGRQQPAAPTAKRMGAMQNYVMHCDVRSWRASGVMFDKKHCDRRSNNDWQDSLLVLVDEYLVDFLLKDKGVVEHCLRSCPIDKFRRWNWRLFLRDRGAKASGLTEGIHASAQVEFRSQLGANVRCPKIVTMNFVQDTLPNVISRPLLEPYRYNHTSRQGFPSTRHEQTVLQHNDDERQLTSCPFMPCVGEWWWLIGKSNAGRKMCAVTDESISTLKSPDCSQSSSSPILLLVQRNHSNLPSLPPFFFWKYLLSLSLSLSLSLCLSVSSPLHFFFYSSVPGVPHRKHTNIYLFSFTRIAWSSFCCFFFVKESGWIFLSLTPALHSFHNKTNL